MKLRRLAVLLTLSVALLLVWASPVAVAADTGKTATNSASQPATGNGSVQGYAADSELQDGTIVELEGHSTDKVMPITQKDTQAMYGVVVDQHQLSLTITDDKLTHEAFVATSGTYDVLVNTQAGAIKAGDYVTVSSLDGIGMNAGTSGAIVFGRAVSGFDGKNNVVGTTQLKDTSGKAAQTVSIGLIPVAINIQRNPNQKSTEANLPKKLQRIGEAIADKPVATVRVYLSIAITTLSVVITAVIMYSGIRNGFISIGRNPLSKKTVFRGLLEIILVGIIILIIGLFAVYLLLKL